NDEEDPDCQLSLSARRIGGWYETGKVCGIPPPVRLGADHLDRKAALSSLDRPIETQGSRPRATRVPHEDASSTRPSLPGSQDPRPEGTARTTAHSSYGLLF